MKKINIKTITKADKTSIRTKQRKHSVLLNWGVTVYFSDIKEAKAFLVKTNEFLTFKLFELNEIYIESFTHYRRSWFYLSLDQDTACRVEISNIEKDFRLSIDRSNWVNGSVYVFKWIDQIADSLKSILNQIREMHRNRGNWAEIRVISAIEARINYLIMQVNKWPEKD
ncbi:hypothetical protein JZU46_01795 [bacterium]|nr:hypothetical protein [bacterium]